MSYFLVVHVHDFLRLCRNSSRLACFGFFLINHKRIVGDFSRTQTPTEIEGEGKLGRLEMFGEFGPYHIPTLKHGTVLL